MARLAVLLAALLAVGAVVLLSLKSGGDDASDVSGLGHDEGASEGEASLRGTELVGRPGAPREEPGEAVRPRPPPGPDESEVRIRGVVLSAVDGSPIAGATVFLEPSRKPCPRSPPAPLLQAGRAARPVAGALVTAGRDGRFEHAERPSEAWALSAEAADCWAWAPGYVPAVACGTAIPGDVVLRLDKALTISGRVFDRQKRPVADARVVASPAPGVPDLPGHASATASDGEGRFVVDGLLPGGVMLTAGTDTHYPTTVGPVAPEDGREVEIVLLPALRATFEIETDDGGAVENASVRWQTTGTPPRQALQILPLLGRAEGDAPSEVVRSEVVKVPCEGPTASFEVKADGYAPWKSDPVELPPDGGETTIALTLRRDTGQASLRVMLEDERGTKVHFVNAHAFPTVMRLDGVHVTSGFVIEPGEDVRFTSLPPGPYRIGIHAHDFAPREVDVTVSPGEQAETKVVLEPAAKVRVRFVAPEAVIVRFRVTQGGRVVLAMPEGSVQGTDAATQEPIYAAGASGLLLGGMAPGTYAIEVTNDDLGPSTTTVRLREGETEEVEIPVRGR